VPRFRAELKAEGKTATYVVVPLDVPAVFGRARPPVHGTVNGAPFRSTITKYGGDDYYLVVNREVREAAGVAAGETVEIEVELDTKPRIVRLPKDLAAALDDEARASFDAMSYTHRKEYVDWIKEAKREDTRRRRIAKAVGLIRQGKAQR
jgi:bifunctional DNA-binding transcriptional regulator/antitoxin component of YhaV-PrlF toxin-antitoxin module